MGVSVDLRAMVREVLREAIATHATPAAAPAPGVQAVRIGCDADRQAFITRLAAPGMIEGVRAGSVKFRLTEAQSQPAPAVGPTVRLALDGVVSEQKLLGLAAGTTVSLGTNAVLTPLAKDAARRLGLKFERNGR